MIETYIKNKGMTRTFFQDNNERKTNALNWDTDYDGNVANISLHLNYNGTHKNIDFSLDNNDLANMLNMKYIYRCNIATSRKFRLLLHTGIYMYSISRYFERGIHCIREI
jgi:hypothetical protein